MGKNSKYDERQLNLMLQQLIEFEKQQIGLSLLVANLESLFHVMEVVSNEWEEEFFREFSKLESINAEVPKMRKDEIEKIIKEAVINLKNQVEKRLLENSAEHNSH